MTSYVFYPVTGDGLTQLTQFVWNTGLINWNTTSDWSNQSTLVFQNPGLTPGAVPGSGTGTGAGASQGAGADDVGLIAGEIASFVKSAYVADPAKGKPFIGSNVYSVDVLINTGTVDIHNFLLSAFNQYADAAQHPTLEVTGATFKVEGTIGATQAVLFPTITNVPFIGTAGGLLTSSGGGIIDIAGGGTVQVAGAVETGIAMTFRDGNQDVLSLGGVSATTPAAFAGSINGFGQGDTIVLPALLSPATYTKTFANKYSDTRCLFVAGSRGLRGRHSCSGEASDQQHNDSPGPAGRGGVLSCGTGCA